MADELTYRRLCDIVREEKSTNNLVSLSADFEMSASELVAKMGQDARLAGHAEATREFENGQRLLAMLMRIRRQKVVFRALQDGPKHETAGMTEMDHSLFDRVCNIVSEEEVRVGKVVSGKILTEEDAKAKIAAESMNANGGNGSGSNAFAGGGNVVYSAQVENSLATEAGEGLKKLRIIKDVKAYRGADGSTVGPFKIGDEVPLPQMEADLLVRGRLAESI